MKILIIDGQNEAPDTELAGTAERSLAENADLIVGVHLDDNGKLIASVLKARGPAELDVVEQHS